MAFPTGATSTSAEIDPSLAQSTILELEPRPALGAVLATAGLRALHGGALAALGALLLAWILWRSLAALRRRRARQRVAGASA